jgi:signal peptidase I
MALLIPREMGRVRLALYGAFLLLAVVLIYWFGVRGLIPFKVPSHSMAPALLPGDFIFAVPEKAYHRGEIVVLRDPLIPGGYLVKRVVGVAGDSIEVDNGYLSINGKYASEPYLPEPIEYVLPRETIPEGEVLVLGDNRNYSDDASRWLIDPQTGQARKAEGLSSNVVGGRTWKRSIPTSAIEGKARYIYLPFSRMGPIRPYPLTNVDGE